MWNQPREVTMSTTVADVELGDFNSFYKLQGRVAVVTGGSRGLGLSAASGSEFSSEGKDAVY
jgi:hypothetical protein